MSAPSAKLQPILRRALAGTGAAVALIQLVNGRVLAIEQSTLERINFEPAEHACREVIATGQSRFTPHWLFVPVKRSDGRPLGAFGVLTEHDRTWTEDDARWLDDLAKTSVRELEDAVKKL